MAAAISTIALETLDTQPVFIFGRSCALDLGLQTLSIQWGISGCADHPRAQGVSQPMQSCLLNRSVDLYFDNASNLVFSYNPDRLPSDPTQRPAYIQGLNDFRVVHKLHPSPHLADSYTFNVLAFAIDPATNIATDIGQFEVAESLDWFTVSSHGKKVMRGFTVDQPTLVEAESYALTVEIRRSGAARALNACIFAANWILTLGIVYFAWARASVWVSIATALLSVSVALAIPVTRDLYVGIPPFGARLDVVTFYSQIITTALSSIASLYKASKLPLSGSMSPKPRGDTTPKVQEGGARSPKAIKLHI